MKLITAIIGILTIAPCSVRSESDDAFAEGGFITSWHLEDAETRLASNDPISVAAWTELKERADAALNHTPEAPDDFYVPRFYSDRREEHIRNKSRLSSDASAAFYLAVAHRISCEERFAEKAVEILDHWASRNQSYSGSDGALVMCYNGTGFLFAAELLQDSKFWSAESKERFVNWVGTVLRPASKIRQTSNNWACWGVMTALACDVFLQDTVGFETNTDLLKSIIDEQIEKSGAMPEEIRRGKRGIWYTYFALAPLTVAIEIVRNSGGPNLYHYQGEEGGSIYNAISYFFERGLLDQSQWPRANMDEEIEPSGKHGALMFSMGLVYDQKPWIEFAEHPVFRDHTGLAWICPSLLRPRKLSPPDS